MSRITWTVVPALLAWTLMATSVLSGCSLTTYKVDVQQGNVITQEMLDKLRPEMTRAQVRFVMGTPLVADSFHPERWDYFYEFDRAGNATERRRLTLLFDDDRLSRVVGDVKVAPALLESSPSGGPAGDSDEDKGPEEK